MKEQRIGDKRVKTDRLDWEMSVTPIVVNDEHRGYVRGDGMVALFAEGGTIHCKGCGRVLVQRKDVMLPDPEPDMYCGYCYGAQQDIDREEAQK